MHRCKGSQTSAEAIHMRLADIRVLQELIVADLLSDSDLEVALRVIARHRRNVGIRRFTKTFLGEKLSTRLIERMTGRGSQQGSET